MAKSKQKIAEKDDWEEVPAAPEADDWQELPASASQNPSEARAIAKGAGFGVAQAVTRGYLPRMTAYLANKIGGQYKDLKTGEMRDVVDYKTARDRNYQEIAQAEADAPKSFMVGNVVANIADPTQRISPTAGLGRTMLMNGAQGFLYNPGDNPGEDSGLQLEQRAVQGGGASLLSGAMKMGADRVTQLAGAHRMKGRLERPGAEQSLKEEVDNAIQKLRGEYIEPRAEQVNKALKKGKVSFNPDNLSGASGVNQVGRETRGLERLGQAMKKRADKSGRVTLRGDKAERLRQVLDRRSGISSKTAVADPKVAKSGASQAGSAQILRNQRRSAFPELEPKYEEMSYANGLINELRNKSGNPESMLKGQYFGDMGNKIIDFDSMAGTNLRKLGADIQGARFLQKGFIQSGLENPSALSMLLNGVTKPVANTAATASRVIEPFTGKGLGDASIKLLLEEAMRGKFTPYVESEEEEE